jgi:hypothetical protein
VSADPDPAGALAEAVVAALPGWVERCVRSRWPDADAASVQGAQEAAVREVGGAVRALLAADVDEQWTTPLALLRDAVRYPTAVLHAAGVPPVARDPFAVDRFPDDAYDLTPASFADVDPSLADVGLVWGASKALAHKQRHNGA